MKRIRFCIAALALLLAFGTPGSAHAANCSSPTKPEGTINYNPTYHAMEFCNGTTWISMGGGAPKGSDLVLISTQTASASASLQFTNLPTSYNTLFLNCSGLVAATNSALALQYGEGATPTWETTGYYGGGHLDLSSGTGVEFNMSNVSFINLTSTVSNTNGASVKAWISNVGSSSITKWTTASAGLLDSSGKYDYTSLSATYTGDTNLITALKVFFGAGNIASGTCSLYGLN